MKSILSKKQPLFISEIGLNHNGDCSTAEKMIIESARAGANAVKFQTFIPEKMNSIYTKDLMDNDSDQNSDNGVIDFLSQFTLSEKEYRHLFSVAKSEGVIMFSAPFDMESLKLLMDLDVELLKIASSEMTNTLLLKNIATTGKPAILSTGMSSESEIRVALDILDSSNSDIALLHCVSLYPIEAAEANLRRITTLKSVFSREVGISDHCSDIINPVIAASLGSRIFEKHFMLDENHTCPDKDVSITPEKFRKMVDTVKDVFDRLGDGEIKKISREDSVAKAARRSLFASRDIAQGEKLSEENLICLRPGTGIPANMLDEITGKTVNRDIKKDSILKISYLDQG